MHADENRILAHWTMLCGMIGKRYAGTSGERDAADYIADQLQSLGLTVQPQLFEFPGWDYDRCDLRIAGRRLDSAVPMEYSVSTPGGGVRGPIVYLQGGSELDFAAHDLRGKIGLMIGSQSIGDPAVRQRIESSGAAAMLLVDERMPFGWKVPIGAAPQWTIGYRTPTVAIPYLEAARIAAQVPLEARLDVRTCSEPATSINVVAELPGSDLADEVILISAHHDAVRGSVGANDNASGCVFVLELARLLAAAGAPRRTLRFITYGVEERLSVGSYHYFRTLSDEACRRVMLAVNADGIGSAVGNDSVLVTGTAELHQLVESHWKQQRHPATIRRGVTPYSDHFAMNIAGAPSIWIGRPNMLTGGYWTAHSEHDHLKNVSTAVLRRTIETAAALIGRLAHEPRLPFPRRLDEDHAAEVARLAIAQFHHPRQVSEFDYDRFR